MAMSSFQRTELGDAEFLCDARSIVGPPWRYNLCGGRWPGTSLPSAAKFELPGTGQVTTHRAIASPAPTLI